MGIGFLVTCLWGKGRAGLVLGIVLLVCYLITAFVSLVGLMVVTTGLDLLWYYSQHHTYLTEVKAAQVKWDLVGDNSESMIRFLPIMQTDIFLRLKEKILIIDAKYYGRTLQHQFDKYTLHSGNVYQIFTYVKNQDKDNTGNVAGILLYAKTDEAITPDCMFNMGGNQIGAKTLDLNTDFKVIAAQLDKIAEDFFHVAAA